MSNQENKRKVLLMRTNKRLFKQGQYQENQDLDHLREAYARGKGSVYTSTLENTLVPSRETEAVHMLKPISSTPRSIPYTNVYSGVPEYICKTVYNSIVPNSQIWKQSKYLLTLK